MAEAEGVTHFVHHECWLKLSSRCIGKGGSAVPTIPMISVAIEEKNASWKRRKVNPSCVSRIESPLLVNIPSSRCKLSCRVWNRKPAKHLRFINEGAVRQIVPVVERPFRIPPRGRKKIVKEGF